MTRPYELLVFDWDGTLVNSCHHITESMQAAIRDMDWPMRSPDEIKDHIGCGMFELIQSLYPDLNEKQRASLIERYRQHFFAGVHKTTLFEGARESLEDLHKQGYLMAIATGESRQRLDTALDEMQLRPYFVTTRCVEESFAKPHPQILLDIMDFTGMKPHQTLAIGDTEFDMQMAINAQVQAVAVACGVHDTHRLVRCQPLACLNSVNELPAWLKQKAWLG